jgi:hypothetical protein
MAINKPTTGIKTKLIMAKATLSSSSIMPILKFENLSSIHVLLSMIHLSMLIHGLFINDGLKTKNPFMIQKLFHKAIAPVNGHHDLKFIYEKNNPRLMKVKISFEEINLIVINIDKINAKNKKLGMHN